MSKRKSHLEMFYKFYHEFERVKYEYNYKNLRQERENIEGTLKKSSH
jgi:hypothetical protein